MAIMQVDAAGISTISGAIKRPKKIDGHSHGNYLVAVHRKAASENPNCQRVYSFDSDRYKRTKELSQKEIAVRERFSAVQAAVKVRQNDLAHITQDQADFLAQKNLANGKKTMRAYLWKVCGDEYDEAHNG